jgi:hypothetical protein
MAAAPAGLGSGADRFGFRGVTIDHQGRPRAAETTSDIEPREHRMDQDDLTKKTKQQMEQAAATAALLTRGMQTMALETAEYSRGMMENATHFMEKLSQAKTLADAMQLQTDYARKQFDGLVAQATKLSDLYKDIATQAAEPFEKAIAAMKDLTPKS